MDTEGHTIDFLLIPTRDRDAAEAFLHKAIRTQRLLQMSTIDRSGANTAAIAHHNRTHCTVIIIRHSQYLNNVGEQDHRAVKRITHSMLGLKSFWAACCTIASMEVMPAIRKGQWLIPENAPQTPAARFYALAVKSTKTEDLARLYPNFVTEPFFVLFHEVIGVVREPPLLVVGPREKPRFWYAPCSVPLS